MVDGANPAPDKPKTKTETLAETVTKAHEEGKDLTGFQAEVSALSNQEQLQFIKDVNNTRSTSGDPNKSLYADGTLDTTSGKLVDIDLYGVDRTDLANVKHTHADVFTPGEDGEVADKQQEIEKAVLPYKSLVWMMNVLEFQKREGKMSSSPDIPLDQMVNLHVGEIGRLMEADMKGNPDKAAMLAELEIDTLTNDESDFKSVDASAKGFGTPGSWDGASAAVIAKRDILGKQIDETRQFNPHNRQYGRPGGDGRQSGYDDARSRYRDATEKDKVD